MVYHKKVTINRAGFTIRAVAQYSFCHLDVILTTTMHLICVNMARFVRFAHDRKLPIPFFTGPMTISL